MPPPGAEDRPRRVSNDRALESYTDTAASGSVGGGSASGASTMFTDMQSLGCSFPDGHLYCFGVDRVVAVSPVSFTGRRAFVTKGNFTLGGGLATADALCASEANAAGLVGTFLAGLATTAASIQSRFDTTGMPWVRADGLALAPTAAELFTRPYLDVALNISADGTKSFGNYGVWSGATSWSSAGTAASTCNDYTSTTGSAAEGGRTGETRVSALLGFAAAISCAATWMRLLCLQQ